MRATIVSYIDTSHHESGHEIRQHRSFSLIVPNPGRGVPVMRKYYPRTLTGKYQREISDDNYDRIATRCKHMRSSTLPLTLSWGKNPIEAAMPRPLISCVFLWKIDEHMKHIDYASVSLPICLSLFYPRE